MEIAYHNDFLNAVYGYNITEKKLLIGIALKIVQADGFGDDIQLSAREVCDLVGMSHGSLRLLKPAVSKLMTTLLELPTDNPPMAKDKMKEEWQMVQVLGKSSYKNGILTIRIDPILRPYFMDLKNCFTKYNLINIQPLNSQYSIRIFELIKQYQPIGKRSFEIDDLRKLLGVENKFRQFGEFRKNVLEQARKDLLKYCDVYFTYTLSKKGKAYSGIQFKIHTKTPAHTPPASPELFPLPPQEDTPESKVRYFFSERNITLPNEVTKKLKQYSLSELSWILQGLKEYDVSVKSWSAVIAAHPEKILDDMLGNGQRLEIRRDKEAGIELKIARKKLTRRDRTTLEKHFYQRQKGNDTSTTLEEYIDKYLISQIKENRKVQSK